jgi:predicted negative regulator of RcsB-dependent stress response
MLDGQHSSDVPLELIDAFAKGDGTVFVGAGLSMGAGLPSWAGLMEPIRAQLPNLPPLASFPDIAQYFENKYGRRLLVETLSRELELPSIKPTPAHYALASLPVTRFFTTNLDRLLEAAFDAQGILYRISVMGHDIAYTSASRRQVVKIHGDLNQPDSIVITKGDYNKYLTGDRAPLAELLKIELQTRTLLFLGYSFNDHDLNLLLSQISLEERQHQRNIFSLQISPNEYVEEELRRQGIRTVRLNADVGGNINEVLTPWLHQLGRQIEDVKESLRDRPDHGIVPRGDELPGPDYRTNHNLPMRPVNLVDREAEITRVLTELSSSSAIVAVEGFPGTGKTTLALEVAHECILHSRHEVADIPKFDYIVWVSASGELGRRYQLDEVLNQIAVVTKFSRVAQLPATEIEKKKVQIELLLWKYNILIILNDFESSENSELIEWLNHVPGSTKVLITTRQRQVVQGKNIELKGLDDESSLRHLHQLLRDTGFNDTEGEKIPVLNRLARVTAGNPEAMRLTLRLLKTGNWEDLESIVDQLEQLDLRGDVDTLFDELLSKSWEALREPSKKVLLVTPLFTGTDSIRKGALQSTAGLESASSEFDRATGQLGRFGLLDQDRSDVLVQGQRSRYSVHPITRTFACAKLNSEPRTFEIRAKKQCSEYFIALIRRVIVRQAPDTPYWNTLVSDGMLEIDPEWPMIQQILRWAEDRKDDKTFTNLVTVLVHYMDSRLHNSERLIYCSKAAEIFAERNDKYNEALLRIDSLGWTYVEEGLVDKAEEEISKGLALTDQVAQEERDDLRALAQAWLARCQLQREQFKEAFNFVEQAKQIQCSPWIRYRVNLASGDIALTTGGDQGYAKALQSYREAEAEADRYGGEGHCYQTAWRIALASIGAGDITSAKDELLNLRAFEQIAIGRLYADYGLAMIALKEGDTVRARAQIDDVSTKISREAGSYILLSLIDKLYEDLKLRKKI